MTPQLRAGRTDKDQVDHATEDLLLPPGESSGLLRARSDILGEIALLQQGYLQNNDVDAMWQQLLESLLRSSGCDVGFIAEMIDSDRGIPKLETRASTSAAALPPALSLVISQVVAGRDDVFIALPTGDHSFLGLPLVASNRVIGVVGLSGPSDVLDPTSAALLKPLVNVVASIIEALRSAAERDAAMERLEKNLAFLQAVVGSAALGVVVVDEAGVVELANDAAAAAVGVVETDLVGQSLLPFMAEGDSDWILDQFESPAIAVEAFSRRTVTMLADRSIQFSTDMTVSVFKLGGAGYRAVIMFRDIEAELLAQATATRSADLLAATPDLVAWTASDGSIDYLNAGGRSLIRAESIEGLRVEHLFPPWAVEVFNREIIETTQREGSWMGELALIASDGEEIPVSMTCLFRDDGSDVYFAVLARDLREHRHLELLQTAFVSTVSHELRTPLTGILGYLEMFGEGELGEVGLEQQMALDVMRRNGHRLLDLVKKLLQVASIGETAIRNADPVNLEEILHSVTDAARARHAGDVVVSADCDDPSVLGSRSELETLVTALMENAVKFSPNGGTVNVQLSSLADRVELSVSDEGMGIPGADLERIFDRFFRASNARSMETQGAGLGLAIARAIVRKHGGEITVDSALGEGTTARVVLPAPKNEGGDHDGNRSRG